MTSILIKLYYAVLKKRVILNLNRILNPFSLSISMEIKKKIMSKIKNDLCLLSNAI